MPRTKKQSVPEQIRAFLTDYPDSTTDEVLANVKGAKKQQVYAARSKSRSHPSPAHPTPTPPVDGE